MKEAIMLSTMNMDWLTAKRVCLLAYGHNHGWVPVYVDGFLDFEEYPTAEKISEAFARDVLIKGWDTVVSQVNQHLYESEEDSGGSPPATCLALRHTTGSKRLSWVVGEKYIWGEVTRRVCSPLGGSRRVIEWTAHSTSAGWWMAIDASLGGAELRHLQVMRDIFIGWGDARFAGDGWCDVMIDMASFPNQAGEGVDAWREFIYREIDTEAAMASADENKEAAWTD